MQGTPTMGLRDLFKLGKVLVGTAQAVRSQRSLGREIAALPMPAFVDACVQNLNQSAGEWTGRARPPAADAEALARQKRLPSELREFYACCNGFEAVKGPFPAAVLPLAHLKLGADCQPPLSERLARYWAEHGNDAEQPGLLSVLPPDDLAALATHSAQCHLRPALLDLAVPLCAPEADRFTVLLLAPAGPDLPRGTVLDVEGGAATRYAGFKAWLGSYASLFGSMSRQMGAR
jgi:hypothetical protein